jgi:hypothetical protein
MKDRKETPGSSRKEVDPHHKNTCWGEEVTKSPVVGQSGWVGIHSGRPYKDSEVEQNGPFAFGYTDGGWGDWEE